MKIIEYRLNLPLEVDEYKTAQLYMTAKASIEQSSGGEGVEVVKNEPYERDGEKGQYTHKVIHIGSQLPGWIKALMPSLKTLTVDEQSWNAYPVCRTEYKSDYLGDKFALSIHTIHKADRGESENVHELSNAELKERKVQVIDIAYDDVDPKKYKKEEDPTLFLSQKTQRGQLKKDWKETVTPTMCCYKLVKMTFKYWGFQTQVEKYVAATVLRDIFFNSHRQCFCWIDEWHGLTMDDIRKIETDAQDKLNAQFTQDAAASGDDVQAIEANPNEAPAATDSIAPSDTSEKQTKITQ